MKIELVSMRREATKPITLPDGTLLPKGATIMVSSHQMWDSSVYPDAHEFDGYRFLKMREQGGQENTAQLVSTTPSHFGFGHGRLACPGRFFAANELKIALCHVLLKYELKPLEGSQPKVVQHGINLMADLSAKIAIRRRKEEISV